MTSPAAPRTYIDPASLLQIDDPSVGDPPPLTYAEITGRVLIAITDRPDDPDRYPDLITPDGGRIIFTPVMTQTMASNEALIALTPKVGAFDSAGFVISPDGMPGIWLIDLGDPTLNPNVPPDQGSYRVSFENITAGGVPLRLASFAIHPVAGQVNDLGVIAPVIPGQGEPMVVGPPGPTGPPGPPNTLTAGPTTTGAPGSNASVVITGTSPNQTVAFTIPRGDVGPAGDPTAFELRGTGSPQNSVAAPVGSYYTDTAATNGAIRWIKQTGTGTTGWRVMWGDTGLRTITANLINGWTATSCMVRRINDTVTMHVAGLNPAAATADVFLADLGVGWRGISGQSMLPAATNGTPTVMARFLTASAAAGFTLGNRTAPAGQVYAGIFVWTTLDTWPASSLP